MREICCEFFTQYSSSSWLQQSYNDDTRNDPMSRKCRPITSRVPDLLSAPQDLWTMTTTNGGKKVSQLFLLGSSPLGPQGPPSV
jgi:hypothetical protein